jgi:hypothetical protein
MPEPTGNRSDLLAQPSFEPDTEQIAAAQHEVGRLRELDEMLDCCGGAVLPWGVLASTGRSSPLGGPARS